MYETITIDLEEAKFILGDEFSFFQEVTATNVFCSNCFRTESVVGMQIKSIQLFSNNDVGAKGTCRTCGGSVARLIEVGDNPEVHNRAIAFRRMRYLS